MAKLITYLTGYWKYGINLPLQYWTRINGKYNNISYRILKI
jgi:hypothetical protein